MALTFADRKVGSASTQIKGTDKSVSFTGISVDGEADQLVTSLTTLLGVVNKEPLATTIVRTLKQEVSDDE